ncbi:MAG TPA: bifunctional (p)ppGpp synthetase/guanosine-3',5'-bis(diphosphate) 3'-pyrophosphohydrolase [Anaerolineaceae bacterium]
MKIEALMESLPETISPIERDRIMRAYQVAEKAHAPQKRASGEPYITHCVAVAGILNEMKMPANVIIAALLHDTVEDTEITLADIRKEFGEEVATMVDGVTKLTNLPRVSRADQHVNERIEDPAHSIPGDAIPETAITTISRRRQDLASETLRKTFLAMGDDIRVVIIKLADRLHNMRTLGYMPESKRKRIAQETLDIFAPLANRLGIWEMKWELEDLSFRYTNPEKFKEIAAQMAESRAEREQQIEQIIQRLKSILDQVNIKADITGRPKHIYSIYRKMNEKGKTFEMVRDLRAVRLIVPDIPACYTALGVIHTHWRPIPHEFDDYIAAPKDNFYQSLHTAVVYDDGKPLEVQIRTPEMHQNSEYGIAAHWRYKERGRRDDAYEQRINWIRKLMEWRQDVTDAQEFVDSMKTDVFQDRVYVFTPRGDIIDLPAGSTPIDFAYHVHTEIGNRCRGAKVNGKLVTLDYTLKTGDQVEILTAKQGGPSRDWLNINLGLVKTQRARSKIRQWFKREDWEQNLTQGKLLLERELHRLGMDYDITKLMQEFGYKSHDELFVAIGCGDLSIGKVINYLGTLSVEEMDTIFATRPLSEPSKGAGVTVLGMRGILTSIAQCCKPVPEDEIIGYITRGRGVTIHREDCPNILRTRDRERLIKVSWGEPPKTYPITVEVKAYDRQGLMGDITTLLKDESINIIDVHLKLSHHLATIQLILEIGDITQLSRVLTRMENLPNVTEAHRVRPG